jgi:hypothetical protein
LRSDQPHKRSRFTESCDELALSHSYGACHEKD